MHRNPPVDIHVMGVKAGEYISPAIYGMHFGEIEIISAGDIVERVEVAQFVADWHMGRTPDP